MSDAESQIAQKEAQIQVLTEKISKLEGEHCAALKRAHELQHHIRKLQIDLAKSVRARDLRALIDRAWLTDWRKTENDLIAAGLGYMVSEIKIDQQAGRLRY